MSLWAEVHRLALEHPEGDPKPIAQQYLDQIPTGEMVDLLANAILQARRNYVRTAEQEAFTPLPPDAEQVEGFRELLTVAGDRPPKRLPREQFLDLLNKTFSVGDHRHTVVKWGAATIAQHQSRIEMLRKQARGINTTIGRHQDAIAMIEEEHATCLNDVLQHDGGRPPTEQRASA